MCKPENLYALQNGTLGINYLAVNEDGIPVQAQANDAVPDEYKIHAGDVAFMSNGLYFGSDEKNAAAAALSFPGYEEQVAQSMVYALTDAWTQISFTVPIEASTDYSATVTSKQNELIAQILTCSAEDFDKVWDEYIQAILDSGAEEVIEAYREAYKEGNWRGSFPVY